MRVKLDGFDGNASNNGASAITAPVIDGQFSYPIAPPTTAEGAVLLQRQQIEQIVHDLLNPLTVVQAVSQSIIRTVDHGRVLEGARLLADMLVVSEAVTKAVQEIDRFLESTRVAHAAPAMPMVPVDFVLLLREVVEDCRRVTAVHDLVVLTEHASLIGPGDRGLLLHAFDNILRNAIKYSPDGGKITVSLGLAAGDDIPMSTIVVSDEGIGIPEAALPRISERFYRAENVSGIAGTGLGLSGALRIFQTHGGDMRVESAEGKGCDVTIRLPVHQST